MSVEFHSEVEKIKSIIGRYTGSKVQSENYRVRVSESTGERYVRVEFKTNIHPVDLFDIDNEKLSNSIHKFLSDEYYTLAYVAPKEFVKWGYRHAPGNTKLGFVVKFFVD